MMMNYGTYYPNDPQPDRKMSGETKAALMIGYILVGGALLALVFCCVLDIPIPGMDWLNSCLGIETSAVSGSDCVSDADNSSDVSLPRVEEVDGVRLPNGDGESLTITAHDGKGTTYWCYIEECDRRLTANGSVYDTIEWMENGDIVYINNACTEILTAFDRSTGEVLWNLEGVFGCPIVYDFGSDGTLYIGSANEFYGPAVVAVSADGRELWRVTEYYTTTGITVYEDRVSVDFDDWGYCYTVDFDFEGNEL